jgi:hypothetical protein
VCIHWFDGCFGYCFGYYALIEKGLQGWVLWLLRIDSLLYHRWVICRDWEQVSNAGEGGGLTVGFVGVQVRKWKDGE